MYYKKFLVIFLFLFLSNCVNDNLSINTNNQTFNKDYSNKGFTLIYNDDLFKQKIISKKLDERGFIIIQRNLKKIIKLR